MSQGLAVELLKQGLPCPFDRDGCQGELIGSLLFTPARQLPGRKAIVIVGVEMECHEFFPDPAPSACVKPSGGEAPGLILLAFGQPSLVRVNVVPKACRHEQVTPVHLCYLDGTKQLRKAAPAHFQRRKPIPLQFVLAALIEERKIGAALFVQECRHFFVFVGPKQKVYAFPGLWTQHDFILPSDARRREGTGTGVGGVQFNTLMVRWLYRFR